MMKKATVVDKIIQAMELIAASIAVVVAYSMKGLISTIATAY